MGEFANKTHLQLEPGISPTFAIGTTGVKYNTPDGAKETLSDLARLRYLKGRAKYRLSLDAAESSMVVSVRVKVAGATVGSEQVTFSGEQHYYGSFALALGEQNGTDQIEFEVEVDTAAATATVAQIAGAVEVEHPIVIS